MVLMATVKVEVPGNIHSLIAEREEIINRAHFRKGDGDRLYQLQVLICSYFCDAYKRGVQ